MEKKIKVCVIQLTRIGDILQTYVAAKQLKSENSNVELTLITRRKFSTQLRFLLKEAFDHIIEFETKDFLDKSNINLREALVNTHNFIHDIKKNEFDLIVNLSFNKSSSYLTTLIADKLKMGLYRNERAQLGIDDKWSQFVYSNVMESSNCPINLIDIFKGILGAKETFATDFKTPKNKVITIHPFASHKRKMWSSSKWTELIEKILQSDKEIEINIVGAPNETAKAREIIDAPTLKIFNKRILNVVGKNSVEDTFNMLSESHLFIGHDSMVSHLAGILRMPSIVLSLGTVKPHETTPYNDRVINLSPKIKCFPCQLQTSCELLPCHKSLNASAVMSVVSLALEDKDISTKNLLQLSSASELDSVRIIKASFDDGGLALSEVTDNLTNTTDAFKSFYRLVWNYYFRDIEVACATPKLSADTEKMLVHHLEGTKHLFEIYSHGFQFCNQILDESEKDSPSVPIIQERVEKLNEIDSLISTTKNAFPQLAPLADFFFVHKANATGNNIIEITNSNLLAFHEATNLTAIINDLLTKTVGPQISHNEKAKEA
jgi:ADP-heptose:LPS heptosyltransferase